MNCCTHKIQTHRYAHTLEHVAGFTARLQLPSQPQQEAGSWFELQPHSFGRHPSSDVSLEPKAATKCWHWNAKKAGNDQQYICLTLTSIIMRVELFSSYCGNILSLSRLSRYLPLCPHLTSLSNLFILKPLLSLLSSILLASRRFFFSLLSSIPFLPCCWLALYLPVLLLLCLWPFLFYRQHKYSFFSTTSLWQFHRVITQFSYHPIRVRR